MDRESAKPAHAPKVEEFSPETNRSTSDEFAQTMMAGEPNGDKRASEDGNPLGRLVENTNTGSQAESGGTSVETRTAETRVMEIDSDDLSDKDLEALTVSSASMADGADARSKTRRGFSFPDLGLDERLGRVLLAFVLAVLLWFYVINLDNPTLTTGYDKLTVEVRNVASQLKVINTIPEVNAAVQGPQSVLATLSQSDIRPYLDVSGLQQGVHEVPVRADLDSNKARDLNVSFSPPRVQVQLELQVTQVFSVTAQVDGTPAFGYKPEIPQVDPEFVQITGSKTAVSNVARVVVQVDIDGKAGTQQGSKSPVALDANGQEVKGLTYDPPTVQVIVPMKLLINYKAVPVRVPIVGQPEAGYWVSSVVITPTNVTVCCSPTEVEDIELLETRPVAIAGATSSVITTTSFYLPPGIQLYNDQPDRIAVVVRVEPIASTVQVAVAPIVEGLAPGYGSIVSPNQLDLTLSGTFEQLQNLNPADVRAVINAEGRSAGTYSAIPQIIVPPGIKLEGVSPEQVTLTIIAPTPAPTHTPIPIPATETREAVPSATPIITRTAPPSTTTPQATTTPVFPTSTHTPQPTRTPEPQHTPTPTLTPATGPQ